MLRTASLLRTIIRDLVPDALRFGTMPKHLENSEKLRVRAEECRALARIVGTEVGRQSYLRLAESYDRLADEEGALAALFPSRCAFPEPDVPAG